MSKDKFALAYSVKRMAKSRRAPPVAAPTLEASPDMELDSIPDSILEEGVEAPKQGVDIGKLIKKHCFFRSK